MSMDNIRPTTLVGIKRLAKSIKTRDGISHQEALSAAARSAGFQNFRHAAKQLPFVGTAASNQPAQHLLYITHYWKDRAKGGEGRETLAVQLSKPWSQLVTVAQMAHHRSLGDLVAEGPDHLVRRGLNESQSRAQRDVCRAARTFQFMDATKLRPSNSHSRVYPGGTSANRIPGADHSSSWYAPWSKQYVFVDEPYERSADGRTAERDAWAKKHDFQVVKVKFWPGMYAPDVGSRLYLIGPNKGQRLTPLAAQLDVLPAPPVEGFWNGTSTPRFPCFVSPGAIAETQVQPPVTQERPKPGAQGPRQTVRYVQTFVGPQRRPKGRMSIEMHSQVSTLLKSVLSATYYRKGIFNRVGNVRCELDEWVMREYTPEELPHEVFSELYYGTAPTSSHAKSLSTKKRRDLRMSIDQVKVLLTENYPNCQPLRSLLSKLDAAIDSLERWTS